MTYSQMVKHELLEARLHCDECSRAFVEAMLSFGHTTEYCFTSDSNDIVTYLAELIVACTGVVATVKQYRPAEKRRAQFYLDIEDEDDKQFFFHDFQVAFDAQQQRSFYKHSCCKIAFLRGAFLTCGVLVNPEKEYHFEFKVALQSQSKQLFELLNNLEQPFKQSKRKDNYIVYLKGSEAIEECLTLIGAQKTAMDLMQVKLMKDLRNTVNRQTNCETANLDKTVKASVKQVDDIEYIFRTKGELYLPEDLREIARCRLQNQEASLVELVSLLSFQISKSGLNHRIKRLSKIAEELHNKEG